MQDSISAAVGQGGVNRPQDVAIVQLALNRVEVFHGGPKVLLAVDGIVGPKTLKAIRDFQKRQIGKDDGRVDQNKKTMLKLNQLASDLPILNDGVSYLEPSVKTRHV